MIWRIGFLKVGESPVGLVKGRGNLTQTHKARSSQTHLFHVICA